jgi:hypothetical protein
MQQFFAKKIIPASPNHRTLQILPWVTLALPYYGNGPQRDAFCNHGGIKSSAMA